MSLPKDNNGSVGQVGRLGASTNLATSATSASYAVTNNSCWAVRLVATVDTRVVILPTALTPVATATSTLLVAGLPEYFACVKGESIAAYSAGAGSLNITEII